MQRLLAITSIAGLLLVGPALAAGNGDENGKENGEPPDTEPTSETREGFGDIQSARMFQDLCLGSFGYDPKLGRNRTQAEYEAAFGPYRFPVGCE